MKITTAHGSGGKATSDLIGSVFAKHFSNTILDKMEDSAVVKGSSRLALTTDSFVVTPLFFPGGDIGRLAVCGTVNDLLMCGATPQYLTCGFIIEEGAESDTLERIARSMAAASHEAHVRIVAGDTKVIEGQGGVYINTSGLGFVPEALQISCSQCSPGDVILLSGTLGDHHATILSSRMKIDNAITSDCAPLTDMVQSLISRHIAVKAMRDVTRGGLGTILNEFSAASGCSMVIEEASLPISEDVRAFAAILGLDPLYMGNEGKMALVVSAEDASRALQLIRNAPYGKSAAIIGNVVAGDPGTVLLNTRIGGQRLINVLYGEGLPRIC